MISYSQEREEIPDTSFYAKIYNTIKNSSKLKLAACFGLAIGTAVLIGVTTSLKGKASTYGTPAVIAGALLVVLLANVGKLCPPQSKVKLKSSLEFTADDLPTEATPFRDAEINSSQGSTPEIVVVP